MSARQPKSNCQDEEERGYDRRIQADLFHDSIPVRVTEALDIRGIEARDQSRAVFPWQARETTTLAADRGRLYAGALTWVIGWMSVKLAMSAITSPARAPPREACSASGLANSRWAMAT